MGLDSESSVPLYKQLKEIIKENIDNGVYLRGQKIPPEVELQKMYNISRITIRNALQELTDEKILERRRGKGTFVADIKLERSISKMMSFTETCEAQGLVPGGKILKNIMQEPTEQEKKELHLKDEERIIAVDRVRFADSVPVSVEVNHFTEKYSFLLNEDLNDSSLFKLLETKYHIVFQNTLKVLELVFADYEMAMYLNVPIKTPLLLVSSVVKDQRGELAMSCKQYILGTKFKFMV